MTSRNHPDLSCDKPRTHREQTLDVGSPASAAEAHRQSLEAAISPYAHADQAFVDAISVWAEA